MSTLHAGIKRSHRDMHGVSDISSSASLSRDASPYRKQSREASTDPVISHKAHISNDWTPLSRKTTFEPNVSVVLIGIRGVGKSSLGVLAATAYGRRLLDSERVFAEATGATAQTYRKQHGSVEYYKKHHQVLKRMLDGNSHGCIIICNFADLEGQSYALLRDYSQTHPVVHVTRDAAGVQSHLKVWTVKRVEQLLCASGPILHSVSNYEFFNLTEKVVDTSGHDDVNDLTKSNGLFLTLKRVEGEFLSLLRRIAGANEQVPLHHSSYPLCKVPVHLRTFTLAAVATVDDILERSVDVDELQTGVDAIELIVQVREKTGSSAQCEVEFQRISRTFSMLRRATGLPIVMTVNAIGTGEAIRRQQAYFTDYCLRLCPEYCTVDLRLRELLTVKGSTLIIARDFTSEQPGGSWDDPKCLEIYDTANQLGCEVVKITRPAQALKDNFAVQSFRERVEAGQKGPRLIAYNSGKEGRPSICFNTVLTPVRSPTNSSPDAKGSPPGDALLTASDVSNALFATFVFEPMHYFICGMDVSWSLSPAMHNAAYKACGMPHKYGNYSSPNLDLFKKLSRETDFGGAAVVQPYKTGVMPLLDGLSSHAQVIGSVNTIVPVRELEADGSIPDETKLLSQTSKQGPVKALYGHNTDWVGIRAVLSRGLSPANTVRPQSTALVCGAGGQARSAIYSMVSLGMRNIFICNRTLSNAQAVADHYNTLIDQRVIGEIHPNSASQTKIRVLDSFDSAWPREYRHPSMIVSGIPTQTPEGTPIVFTLPEDWLRSPTGGVMIELGYRPQITPIGKQMRAAEHKGWIFMDGFDVLPEQAFAQFELFTGRPAPRKLMREVVMKHRNRVESQDGVSA